MVLKEGLIFPCLASEHLTLVQFIKKCPRLLGHLNAPSKLQTASHVAAAELGHFQPIGEMPQVPSANHCQSHAVPTLPEQQS